MGSLRRIANLEGMLREQVNDYLKDEADWKDFILTVGNVLGEGNEDLQELIVLIDKWYGVQDAQ